MRGTPEARFWPKVDRFDPDWCWEWTGGQSGHGHGVFWSGERFVPAHRYTYESLVGPIPTGLELDHLCRVPSCVNPKHLDPVSHMVNSQRGLRGQMTRVCVHGHLYDEENTYRDPAGRRRCRACNRERQHRLRAEDGDRLP